MADIPSDDKKTTPNQGMPNSSVSADQGELTTYKSAGEQEHSGKVHQIASRFLWKPAIKIYRFPRNYWMSLAENAVSNRTIAIATVVIAVATVFTWLEVHEGGKQTDRIVAASESIQRAIRRGNRQNKAAIEATLAQSQKAMEVSNAQSKAALDATIAQSRLDQRAFVNFGKSMKDNAILVAGKNDVQEWEFWPRLGNSGNTPTRNARMRANFLYLPTVLAANFNFPDLGEPIPPSPFGLGPKEQDITGPLLNVPETAIQDVRNKTMHLYFWGWLTYRDVFSQTPLHVSMFCMELSDVRGQLVGGTTVTFNYTLCPRHNCADEECDGEPYGAPSKIWPN